MAYNEDVMQDKWFAVIRADSGSNWELSNDNGVAKEYTDPDTASNDHPNHRKSNIYIVRAHDMTETLTIPASP